ncbi:MAG: alpha-glucosidase [Micromonosporaceae bacterium]
MDSREWWRDAVIYEVYVRSFADGNGDGEGDLIGLRQRLPYLRDLGVDALWLTPFYRSPMVDGGYDVADYRDVDPRFGTLDDFDAMLAAAHDLGLRVIVDIVPNHSSSAHPWFQEALAAPPGSPARQRYLFRDGVEPPNDWESIFGGPAWTSVESLRFGAVAAVESLRVDEEAAVQDGQWYLHLFDPRQPDFNWRNDEVRAEFESILRFWLDRGVDGFRVDVAHGMIKAAELPSIGRDAQIGLLGRDELPYFDQDEVHDIYRVWRKILDEYPGQRIAVAEAWASNPTRLARYVAPDELHQAFNFDFLDAPFSVAGMREVIDACLAGAALVGAPATWVLSNHDVQRHATRLGGGLARARAATLLMLALPGAAYLYQGEELGLPEVLDLPGDVLQDPVWERSRHTARGRDGCRVPLPWSGDQPPFGFGTGPAWLPVPDSWAGLTAQRQAAEPASTLSLYRSALRVRRGVRGPLRWLDAPADLLAFARDGLRCVINLGPAAVPLPPDYGQPKLVSGPLDAGALPPDTSAWF